MSKPALLRDVGTRSRPPKWIKPQLARLVDEAPAGDGWLHEIKFDGYRMHARIDGGQAKLLTRTGLDWSHQTSVQRGRAGKSAGDICTASSLNKRTGRAM